MTNLEKLKEFFYSAEHYEKFISENSFYLFAKGLKRDLLIFEYFKLIQQKFDLIILDELHSPKQVYDTITFFSKHLMIFKELRFLALNEEVDKSEFVYLFDNRSNKEEINANFILEKLKEIESSNENIK